MVKKLLVILVIIIGVVGVLVVGGYFLTSNPMPKYIDELEELGFTVNIGSDKWDLSRENYPDVAVHYQHEDWDNFIEWALLANDFYEL